MVSFFFHSQFSVCLLQAVPVATRYLLLSCCLQVCIVYCCCVFRNAEFLQPYIEILADGFQLRNITIHLFFCLLPYIESLDVGYWSRLLCLILFKVAQLQFAQAGYRPERFCVYLGVSSKMCACCDVSCAHTKNWIHTSKNWVPTKMCAHVMSICSCTCVFHLGLHPNAVRAIFVSHHRHQYPQLLTY